MKPVTKIITTPNNNNKKPKQIFKMCPSDTFYETYKLYVCVYDFFSRQFDTNPVSDWMIAKKKIVVWGGRRRIIAQGFNEIMESSAPTKLTEFRQTFQLFQFPIHLSPLHDYAFKSNLRICKLHEKKKSMVNWMEPVRMLTLLLPFVVQGGCGDLHQKNAIAIFRLHKKSPNLQSFKIIKANLVYHVRNALNSIQMVLIRWCSILLRLLLLPQKHSWPVRAYQCTNDVFCSCA